MFLRQNDPMDEVRHTIMNDLLFPLKQDIESEKKILHMEKGYRACLWPEGSRWGAQNTSREPKVA